MNRKSICAGCFFLVCILATVFTACSHHVPLNTPNVHYEDLPNIDRVSAFRVSNNQSSKEQLNLGSNNTGSYYTSLYELSEASVALLTRTLVQLGMVRSYYTDKKLNVSVSDAKLKESESGWSCAVFLDVETSEGYKASYEAEKLTPDYQSVCGGAITLVVTALLKDQNIIRYLEK